jgi:carboxymethylenebutenolidase
MRTALAVAVSLTLAAPAFAAEEVVTLGGAGKEAASALVVTPEGAGPHPAVVVIHEWWGLDEWVKDQARALAKAGYLALAVDLYHGKVTDKQEEAHQLMMGLQQERAIADLKAAVNLLASRRDVKPGGIGVVGWCMGGKFAFQLATLEPRIAAAVGYYGAPPTDPAAIANIKAAITGNFGAEDKGPTPDQAEAFEAALKKAGKSADIKIYEGAGHAFANVNNPWKGYREEAAKDAWARTIASFDKYLKAGQPTKDPAPKPAAAAPPTSAARPTAAPTAQPEKSK